MIPRFFLNNPFTQIGFKMCPWEGVEWKADKQGSIRVLLAVTNYFPKFF